MSGWVEDDRTEWEKSELDGIEYYRRLDENKNIIEIYFYSGDGEKIKKLDFLPHTLKKLSLPYNYKHPICNLPNSLINLQAHIYYNYIEYPNNLVELHLSLNNTNFPISFGDKIDDIKYLDCSILPRTLKKFWLIGEKALTMNIDKLPDLEKLVLNGITLINGVYELPAMLRIFEYYGTYIGGLNVKKYPEGLEECVIIVRKDRLEFGENIFAEGLKSLRIKCLNIDDIKEKIKYLEDCKMELSDF